MDKEIEKKLKPILIQLMGCCDSIPDEEETEAIQEAMDDISELVFSTVPEKDDGVNSWYAIRSNGFNDCRTKILKQWKDL